MSSVTGRLSGRFFAIALIGFFAPSIAVFAWVQSAAAGAPPSVSLSPAGNYRDGQVIAVGVGPNSYFTPQSRIEILECADPGGSASKLPIDSTTCDGNTVPGGTVVVAANGSFSLPDYTVYLLPSPTLGEQSNYKPICNQTNYCVLYVGQDQNNFTAPKVFSAPFLIGPSGAAGTTSTGAGSSGSSGTAGSPSTASSPSTATTPASPSTSSASAGNAGSAVSLTGSASLANTGSPVDVEWIALSGMALLLCGVVGRRLVLRGAR